jgi:uncharacterized protein (TIGR02147 family)
MSEQISELLIDEFNKRSKKNNHYSLRAFARDLELAPSHLSNLLKGKSGLSLESASRIAKKLAWPSRKTRIFVETVESQFSRSNVLREAAKKRIQKFTTDAVLKSNLKVDEFQFVSQWYHLAILELFEIKNFKMSNEFIASKLGISEEEVKIAITRLLRLKLLIQKKGKLQVSDDTTFVGDDISSVAIRENHSQIIKKALDAINQQDKSERILRSTILAIKKDKVPEALLMLQDFHEKFCEQITDVDNGNKDEVYCLASQFFKLTK